VQAIAARTYIDVNIGWQSGRSYARGLRRHRRPGLHSKQNCGELIRHSTRWWTRSDLQPSPILLAV